MQSKPVSGFAVHLSFRHDAFFPRVSMRSSKHFWTNFTSTGLSGRLWFWSYKKLSTRQLRLFCSVDCWPSPTLPRSLSHRSSQKLAGLHESRRRAHRFTCQGCRNHTAPATQLLKILTGALQSLDQSARGVAALGFRQQFYSVGRKKKSLMKQNSCSAFYQWAFFHFNHRGFFFFSWSWTFSRSQSHYPEFWKKRQVSTSAGRDGPQNCLISEEGTDEGSWAGSRESNLSRIIINGTSEGSYRWRPFGWMWILALL